jgi:hypothetical protein
MKDLFHASDRRVRRGGRRCLSVLAVGATELLYDYLWSELQHVRPKSTGDTRSIHATVLALPPFFRQNFG